MISRIFNPALAGAATATSVGGATVQHSQIALYQSVGAQLRHFDIDVDGMTLAPRLALSMPSNVQYVWPHPSRRFLYVSTSDRASGNAPVPGKVHRLCALRVDASGALQMHGEARDLSTRPVHMSVDASGSYVLNAYNNPSGISVHRINQDGTLGDEVQQPSTLDTGIFAHQVLATPSNRSVILVTRGNDAGGGKPEDPGALKIYHFNDGKLSPGASIAVGGKGGLGYGPRHLDFHPTQPWVYVSVERQNQLHMHRMQGDIPAPEPDYVKDTLAAPRAQGLRQLAGGIHVHPNGRYVYVSNRADGTVDFNGTPVFRGGENSIAVYAIDQATGEPTLIQHAGPRSYHVRTFTIDPSGRMLVAANIADMRVRDGNEVRHVPAGLSVFRIGADGKLEFVRKYEVELGGKFQWWAGIVSLPAAGRG